MSDAPFNFKERTAGRRKKRFGLDHAELARAVPRSLNISCSAFDEFTRVCIEDQQPFIRVIQLS